jgi:hypothetical protein
MKNRVSMCKGGSSRLCAAQAELAVELTGDHRTVDALRSGGTFFSGARACPRMEPSALRL